MTQLDDERRSPTPSLIDRGSPHHKKRFTTEICSGIMKASDNENGGGND